MSTAPGFFFDAFAVVGRFFVEGGTLPAGVFGLDIDGAAVGVFGGDFADVGIKLRFAVPCAAAFAAAEEGRVFVFDEAYPAGAVGSGAADLEVGGNGLYGLVFRKYGRAVFGCAEAVLSDGLLPLAAVGGNGCGGGDLVCFEDGQIQVAVCLEFHYKRRFGAVEDFDNRADAAGGQGLAGYVGDVFQRADGVEQAVGGGHGGFGGGTGGAMYPVCGKKANRCKGRLKRAGHPPASAWGCLRKGAEAV